MNLDQWKRGGPLTRPVWEELAMSKPEAKGSEFTVQQGKFLVLGDYTLQFIRVVDGAIVIDVKRHSEGGSK
jgi:hypothetical protein